MTINVSQPIKILGLIGLGLLLSQCDQLPLNDNPAKETPAPKVEAFAFDVNLSFDSESQKLLQKKDIDMVIDAAYYGTPLSNAPIKTDEAGNAPMGHDYISVKATDQKVHIIPHGLHVGDIKYLQDKQPSLILRARSKDMTDKGRTVDCTIIDETFEEAKRSPIDIHCRYFLIGRTQLIPEITDPKPASPDTEMSEE